MKFKTEQVFSIVIGNLFCSYSELYEICEFLTGTTLSANQLLRAVEFCEEGVLEQYPEFDQIFFDDTDENFISQQKATYGDYIELSKLFGWVEMDYNEEMM